MYGIQIDAERPVGLLSLLEIGFNSKIYVFLAGTFLVASHTNVTIR
jgi:hypothetical protein